ncbi:MAG: amino acid-binding protein [Candidatus Binatia bacterium]|nr:MAG: amino acid-binding protein [Candidatus Binatia bacterium]
MKRWFALSAIGRDRPGIVADLAETVFECDGNLEDSSMTILGSEFAVLMLVSGEGEEFERKLSSACKRLEWEKRLTVFVRPLEGAPVDYAAETGAALYDLEATGVDKAGLVARVARCLADHGANIEQMFTQSTPEPGTGTPIYRMRIRIAVPEAVKEEDLREALEKVARELHIDVSLQRAGA